MTSHAPSNCRAPRRTRSRTSTSSNIAVELGPRARKRAVQHRCAHGPREPPALIVTGAERTASIQLLDVWPVHYRADGRASLRLSTALRIYCSSDEKVT